MSESPKTPGQPSPAPSPALTQNASLPGVGDVSWTKESDSVPSHVIHHTPLHWLALNGDDDGIRDLLSSNPDVHVDAQSTAKDQLKQTPLHWAAVEGRASTVALLLRYSANPSLCDASGYSAAAHASMYSQLDTLHVLISHTPSLATLTDAGGHSPLHWAAHHGHERIVVYLLRVAKAPANSMDAAGKTPLHRAACGVSRSHLAVARHLIRAGANANIVDRTGKNPLALARDQRMRSFLEESTPLSRSSAWGRKLASYSYLLGLHVLLILAYAQYLSYVAFHAPMGPILTTIFHLSAVGILAAVHSACWSSPGYARKGSVAEFVQYIESASKLGITDRAFSSTTYCFSCLAKRVPRSKHSSHANRCVLRFDHFCPFLANDVGAGNHRSLVALLLLSIVTCSIFIYAAVSALRNEAASGASAEELLVARWPFLFVALLVSVAGAVSAGLATTQLMLVARNDTTVASMGRKGKDLTSDGVDVNYDKGLCQNFLEFSCMSGPGTSACCTTNEPHIGIGEP